MIVRVAAIALVVAAAIPLHAQQTPGTTFRVFLQSGEALPSYGEAARVGDRLVFTLLLGEDDLAPQLQLMSLPVDVVDLDRTMRYAEAMRAAHYAATRGEADYAAMTAEVQRALGQLTAIDDPARRLALAREARRRLLDWSRQNHSYRARDIATLAALFDDVIGELEVAAGTAEFALDFRAGVAVPTTEPLLPSPTRREAVALALAAARATDVVEERIAILTSAAVALDDDPGEADLRATVERELEAERTAGPEYAHLADHARKQSLNAMQSGDVAGVSAVRDAVVLRDRELGGRRPAEIRRLLDELDARLARAAAHRLALDHYALIRPTLLAYERRIRPVLSGLDGLEPILQAVADMRSTAYEQLEGASSRIGRLSDLAGRVSVPGDLADVHATLVSALHLAEQASARRRLAVATTSMTAAREASSAAAGAQLLAAQARASLVERLFPPKIRP
jgi:hypothetical protein